KGERVKGIVLEDKVIPSAAKRSRGIPRHDPKLTQRDRSPEPVLSEVEGLGMTTLAADTVVMTVCAWTPYLLPITKKFLRASGQPVFHLRPRQPELFAPENFPVFGADITTTGYYGFPVNRDGVVKIANHGPGREMSPESPKRVVTPEDERNLREFLSSTFPALAAAPIVDSRICIYCDTHDGHFWIARDPEREGLVIAAGDCGHGFKFAPVLGGIIADAVEEKPNQILQKFRWRPSVRAGSGRDVARFRGNLEPSSCWR